MYIIVLNLIYPSVPAFRHLSSVLLTFAFASSQTLYGNAPPAGIEESCECRALEMHWTLAAQKNMSSTQHVATSFFPMFRTHQTYRLPLDGREVPELDRGLEAPLPFANS